MNLSDLKPPKGAKHAKKRVGRGYGSGTGVTSGRGHKGQKSRSGYHHKRGFEGGQMPLHRRLPKRGFFNPFRVEYAVVNLDTLSERFEAGAEVTPDVLRERGIVRSNAKLVKVLGRGDIDTALTVRAHKFSRIASEKIVAAGGHAAVICSSSSRPAADDDGTVAAADAGEPAVTDREEVSSADAGSDPMSRAGDDGAASDA